MSVAGARAALLCARHAARSRDEHDGRLPRLLRPDHQRARRHRAAEPPGLQQGDRGCGLQREQGLVVVHARGARRHDSRNVPKGRRPGGRRRVLRLLVDYALAKGAKVIVRGLRAVADFEYEFQMTMMNRHLTPQVETIFMMTGESHFYTSSRLVKEVVSLGGNVAGLLPDNVVPLLVERAKRFKAGT